MYLRFTFLTAILGCACIAQQPELQRAQTDIEQLRALVEAGAAPRAKLDQAEQSLTDARDADYLRRTLYGQDLTETESQEMISVARRRWERRKLQLEEQKKLVTEGVAAQLSLSTPLEDLDRSRKELDLAESRARLVHELAEMARLEQQEMEAQQEEQDRAALPVAQRYDGDGIFTKRELKSLVLAFENEFARPLPISARGQTALHESLGFDHRGRVDIAVHPDSPEGEWLRHFLESHRIPYFAFRRFVPGKATAAHIHIGPVSTHLSRS